MWLIWLKFYLGTHYYILLTCTKNQDFMLRLKLFLRPIKTILSARRDPIYGLFEKFDFLLLNALKVTDYVAYVAHILPGNTLLYSPFMYQKSRLYIKVKIVFEAHKDHT